MLDTKGTQAYIGHRIVYTFVHFCITSQVKVTKYLLLTNDLAKINLIKNI